MSPPAHHRRSAGARVGAAVRWAMDDTARMLRDWRPPEHPGPDDQRPRREPRPKRYPEPVWGRTAGAAAARRVVQDRALFPLLGVLGRPEVTGREHLEAIAGPVILAPNHVSHSDAPLVIRALPARVRERTLVPAAGDYFFNRRWLSVAATLGLNAVPFDRRNEIADSVRRCERFLRHGYSIVLFPEGTRSQDGRLRGFKAGVAHLAVNTGAPVIPIYLQGSHRLLPRGKAMPRPSAVAVHVGEPLVAGAEETARLFNARLEEAVAALAGEARGWRHREIEPERPSWRQVWRASALDTRARPADGDEPAEAAWRDAVGDRDTLPAAATAGEPGSWIRRWRSTTPR